MKISPVLILLATGIGVLCIDIGLHMLIISPSIRSIDNLIKAYQHGDAFSEIRHLNNKIMLLLYLSFFLKCTGFLIITSSILTWIIRLIGGRPEPRSDE